MMLPPFIYPGPTYMLDALAIAIVLDIVYPYHSGLALRVHPVHTAYVMSQKLYKPYSSRARGVGIWLLVMTSHLALYGALLYLAWLVSPYAWVAVAGYVLKTSTSLRLLLNTVDEGGRLLRSGDIRGARNVIQGIVRRDLSSEDVPHVASAAIESLAESLVDGFTSPLFWYALLGPLGALAQRVANTLDGSLGFLDPPYRHVGLASAMADTIMNYVPARLTALLIAVSARAGNGNTMASLSAWSLCRHMTRSRNAGSPMSAMAGALGVRLEKRGEYALCTWFKWPDGHDVAKGLRISIIAACLGVLASVLLMIALWIIGL